MKLNLWNSHIGGFELTVSVFKVKAYIWRKILCFIFISLKEVSVNPVFSFPRVSCWKQRQKKNALWKPNLFFFSFLLGLLIWPISEQSLKSQRYFSFHLFHRGKFKMKNYSLAESVSGSHCSHVWFKAFTSRASWHVLSTLFPENTPHPHTRTHFFSFSPPTFLFLDPSFTWSTDRTVTAVSELHTAASQRAECFSLAAVGQYLGFTQGAKVLMLHALKNYKMSSLQF